ncbi:unnamed protein product, partial [Didymodactylos carnosus]
LSKLIQLVSPESIILKLPTFENKISRWMCSDYFHQQEHFSIENFINQLISNPLVYNNDDLLNDTTNAPLQKPNDVTITTKIMIFTRTSSYIIGFNTQTKKQFFNEDDNIDFDSFNKKVDNISEKVDVLNLATIDNSVELQEKFHDYEQNQERKVLIIVIDARIRQQHLHIPLVRQMVDKSDQTCNSINRPSRKHFLILIHSPPQELYHRSCFPIIFLYDWDFYFFDTCTTGSAFHLQKMVQILSSSFEEEQQRREPFDDILYDLDALFDDCLWDFCSRIQIFLQELPREMFNNIVTYEFYQRRTSIIKRVHCLKQILQQATQLQKCIVNFYHKYLSTKKSSIQKIYNLIYQISRDILCGKRFDGLVDSIRHQSRISFSNFVSNILKFIVNDYGLETLSNLSITKNGSESFDTILNLIDYSTFAVDDDIDVLSSSAIQRTFQVVRHYSFIPQTLMYNLFYQLVKSHVDNIKSTLIQKENERE